jgi:hypothetical protein
MLTLEQFKKRLCRVNHPNWLLVGVNLDDDDKLYVAVNSGQGNMNCAAIECFQSDIKTCVQGMILSGELYLEPHAEPYHFSQEIKVNFYTYKPDIRDK